MEKREMIAKETATAYVNMLFKRRIPGKGLKLSDYSALIEKNTVDNLSRIDMFIACFKSVEYAEYISKNAFMERETFDRCKTAAISM